MGISRLPAREGPGLLLHKLDVHQIEHPALIKYLKINRNRKVREPQTERQLLIGHQKVPQPLNPDRNRMDRQLIIGQIQIGLLRQDQWGHPVHPAPAVLMDLVQEAVVEEDKA